MASIVCVIVSYYGEQWISRCLESLHSSSVPIHTIVVDNNSGDDTIAIAQKFENTEVIRLDSNRGFAQANNIGIQQALLQEVGYILLLNQDAWIEAETVETLLKVASAHPEYGILSPVHLNHDGSELDSNFQHNFTAKSLLNDLLQSKPQEVYEVSFINAAAWLLSRKCLEFIGGFDPLFFLYGEDNDYCTRVRIHNLKIGVVPKAFIYHARAKVAPIRQRRLSQLYVKTQQMYSILLFSLKRIDRPMSRTLPVTIFQTFDICLRRMFAGDFIAAGAALLGSVRLLRQFNVVIQHRELSRQGGTIWLAARDLR